MDDSVPTEDDIEWVVKLLRNHRSRGPTGMQAKHLKRWMAAARKAAKEETVVGGETTEGKNRGGGGEPTESTEPTDAPNWERVIDLVQTAFREGRLAEEDMWQAVVLIPDGKKYYRGIGLMKVM